MPPGVSSRITVRGVELCVDRVGTGYPVLCLTAIGHDAHDFDPLADLIGREFELIRVEWPGHGRSGDDTEPASAQRYALLIEHLMDELTIDAPIVIGNSIGGAAAVLLASRCPLAGVVLCNSGGLVEVTPTVRRACRLFERFFAAGERGAFWYQAAFALYYRMVLPTPAAAAQRNRIIGQARRSAPALRQAWASFGKPDADIRAVAAQIEAPVWVAWAKRDKVIPLARCLPALKRMKGAAITEFDGGHCAFLECPQAFATEFAAFARRIAPSPPTPLRVAGLKSCAPPWHTAESGR